MLIFYKLNRSKLCDFRMIVNKNGKKVMKKSIKSEN